MFASITWMACDDDDDNRRSLNDTDEDFVENAARANFTEIEFGALAVTKASDPLVREFAEEMVAEHTTAQNELRSLANNYRDIEWADDEDDLDDAHEDMKAQLESLEGYSFDSLYMMSQVNDHEMAVSLFESGTDATETDVKNYASKFLPHIEMHLEKADSINMVITENAGN